jgi:hypothetical protein
MWVVFVGFKMFYCVIIIALLLDASLFAIIQPLLGKTLLPIFGGTPTVWNGTLLFFQGTFFLGAVYAYVKQKLFSPRKQLLSHLILLGLSFLFLPLTIILYGNATHTPALSLFMTLIVCAGLPIFLITCNSVLLQTWCAHSNLKTFSKDPYILFSVSHLGILLGFIAYAIIEPYFGLKDFKAGWSFLFIVFTIAMALVLWGFRKHLPNHSKANTSSYKRVESSDKMWWFIYPLISMGLLMSYTHHITIDLSSFPLLWVAPMVLYSLSFVIAFARQYFNWINDRTLQALQLIFLVAIMALTFLDKSLGTKINFIIHSGFFTTSMLLIHGHLAALRPPKAHLPLFYITMSMGSLMGALLTTIAAPLLLKIPIEYNIFIIATCLVSVQFNWNMIRQSLPWIVCVLAIAAGIFTLHSTDIEYETPIIILLASGMALTLAYLNHFPPQMAVFLSALLVFTQWHKSDDSLVCMDRSFFGLSFVEQIGEHRYYTNGNTLHGAQSTNPDHAQTALAYFHPEGTFDEFIDIFNQNPMPIAVVGLGVGTIAAFAKPHQKIDFFEIDPLVQKIAHTHFTYLSSSQGDISVRIGDGRALLKEVPQKSYGLIVMDAFSSDVVPSHLLTLEAVQDYCNALQDNGALILHATSRYYDFRPLMVGLAEALGMKIMVGNDYATNDKRGQDLLYTSEWFVLTHNTQLIQSLEQKTRFWRQINTQDEPKQVLWTDDYANQTVLLSIR